jgi:hypothetical protein
MVATPSSPQNVGQVPRRKTLARSTTNSTMNRSNTTKSKSTSATTPTPMSSTSTRTGLSLYIPRTHRADDSATEKSTTEESATEKSAIPTKTPGTPARPGVLPRQNSVQTRYMTMLLALDHIPRLHNIYASFFTWILLAGYVIFPGTFTSLQSLSDNQQVQSSETAEQVLDTVKNVPLLWVAAIASAIGAGGMCWLWWRWRDNFVWLINRIFLYVLCPLPSYTFFRSFLQFLLAKVCWCICTNAQLSGRVFSIH